MRALSQIRQADPDEVIEEDPPCSEAPPAAEVRHCSRSPRSAHSSSLGAVAPTRRPRRPTRRTPALRDHRRHDAHRRSVRHLRLQGGGSLGRLPQALPQHHDQGGRRRAVGRLLDAPQDAPRVEQRSRRRPGDRDRLRRRRRAEPRRPVRQLEQRAQRRRGQGGVLPLEVAAGLDQRRQHDRRTGHGHRPGGHLLPQGPAEAGRPARPTPAPSPRSGARGTTSSTSASSTRRRRPSPPAPTSSTAPRASSPRRSTRATRRTPTPTDSPMSRTVTG